MKGALISISELPETQTLDDSNVENEKAQIIEGPVVPGKAVGSKLFPAGEYSRFATSASDST